MVRKLSLKALGVLLIILLAATASAQEQRLNRGNARIDAHLIGRTVEGGEAQGLWARVLTAKAAGQSGFPQAPGVVEITGDAGKKSVKFVSVLPTNGIILSRIVAPNGESITYPPVDLSSIQPTYLYLGIEHNFNWWQNGETRFEFFVIEGGRISSAVGVVNHGSTTPPAIQIAGSPQEVVSVDGHASVALYGTNLNFQNGLLTALVAGWIPVTGFGMSPEGTFFVSIPDNYYFEPGSTSLTVCMQSSCRTMSFEHNLPGGAGGKG